MDAPCTAPKSGICFSPAPEKRQIERSTVPESDGIFMPGIRPDSGRCSQPVSAMLGLAARHAAMTAILAALDPDRDQSTWKAAQSLECLLRRVQGVSGRRIVAGHRPPSPGRAGVFPQPVRMDSRPSPTPDSGGVDRATRLRRCRQAQATDQELRAVRGLVRIGAIRAGLVG